jgi:hypothetical protein
LAGHRLWGESVHKRRRPVSTHWRFHEQGVCQALCSSCTAAASATVTAALAQQQQRQLHNIGSSSGSLLNKAVC